MENKKILNEELNKIKHLMNYMSGKKIIKEENSSRLPNIDDETIKTYLLKNLQPLLDQSKITNNELRIPWDTDSTTFENPKDELEWNTFTELYGIEYNELEHTEHSDEATDKLEQISSILRNILFNKFNKIYLVPINK